MVKIPIQELKTFLSKAAAIKAEKSIVPLCRYIKIVCEGNVISVTKTNLQSFVICELDGKATKNFTLLVEEDLLAACVKNATGKEIKISFKEAKSATSPTGKVKSVTIEDGEDLKVEKTTEDEMAFPVIPEAEKNGSNKLTEDILESIYLASRCTSEPKDIPTYANFVHVKSTGKKSFYIAGMNGAILYFKSFKQAMPDMILELETCAAIKGFQELLVYQGGNYNFFDAGKTLFGFVKVEFVTPDFKGGIVDKMEVDKLFTIDRAAVVRCCDFAKSINPMKYIAPCTIEGDGDKGVVIDYNQNEVGLNSARKFEVKKNKKFSIPKFFFSPNDFSTVLSSLPFEKVNMVGPVEKNYYITSDEDPDFVGALREVAINKETIKTDKKE